MDQLPTQRQCTLQLAGMLQLTHMWDTASKRPQLTDMLDTAAGRGLCL